MEDQRKKRKSNQSSNAQTVHELGTGNSNRKFKQLGQKIHLENQVAAHHQKSVVHE
jgi:hypothetical protein